MGASHINIGYYWDTLIGGYYYYCQNIYELDDYTKIERYSSKNEISYSDIIDEKTKWSSCSVTDDGLICSYSYEDQNKYVVFRCESNDGTSKTYAYSAVLHVPKIYKVSWNPYPLTWSDGTDAIRYTYYPSNTLSYLDYDQRANIYVDDTYNWSPTYESNSLVTSDIEFKLIALDPENPPSGISIHVTYYGDTTATNYLGSMTDEYASGESFFPFDHNSSVEIPSEYVPHTFVYGTSSNIEYAREGTGDSIHLNGSDNTIYVWVFYTIKPRYLISYTSQFNIGYESDEVYEGDTYKLPDPSSWYEGWGYRFIRWRYNGAYYDPGDSFEVYKDMVFEAELRLFTNTSVYIAGDWTEGIAHYWDGNNWKECEINNY